MIDEEKIANDIFDMVKGADNNINGIMVVALGEECGYTMIHGVFDGNAAITALEQTMKYFFKQFPGLLEYRMKKELAMFEELNTMNESETQEKH